MGIKPYSKHYHNARKRDGLSQLLKVGGKEGYGLFWIISEIHGEMQIGKDEPKDYFVMEKSKLLKELGINERTFLKWSELLLETVSIQFESISKTVSDLSYTVLKCTLPNSLINMTNPNLTKDINNININNKYTSVFDSCFIMNDETSAKDTERAFISPEFKILVKTFKSHLYLYSDLGREEIIKSYVDMYTWIKDNPKKRPKNLTECSTTFLKNKRKNIEERT